MNVGSIYTKYIKWQCVPTKEGYYRKKMHTLLLRLYEEEYRRVVWGEPVEE
jgi:hypothetical protein